MPWCSWCGMTKRGMAQAAAYGVTWTKYDGACCNPDGKIRSKERRFVEIGDVVTMEIAHSEACMHMQVAGTIMKVRLQAPHGNVHAQLLRPDGTEFSSSITTGEAGFYCENGRYYCYPVEEAQCQ